MTQFASGVCGSFSPRLWALDGVCWEVQASSSAWPLGHWLNRTSLEDVVSPLPLWRCLAGSDLLTRGFILWTHAEKVSVAWIGLPGLWLAEIPWVGRKCKDLNWPIPGLLRTLLKRGGGGGEARIVNEAFSNHVTTITLPAIGSASCAYEND